MSRRPRSARSLMGPLLLAVALTSSACASAKPRERWWQFWRPKRAPIAITDAIPPPPPGDIPGMVDLNRDGISDALQVPGGPEGAVLDTPPAAEAVRQPATLTSELQTVRFDYDSSDLDSSATQVLDTNAAWIKSRAGVELLIEGHCDERGTVEYNFNLGQRRADTVRAYLVSKGIAPEVLHTISYGEERPLDPGTDESAWARNRRAQFLVY